jgi:hypothetical protein
MGIAGYTPSTKNGTLTSFVDREQDGSIKIWRPQEGKQELILSRSERELCTGGARGGVKTESGLAWQLDESCIKNPRFQGLVLRKNYQDLSDWIQRARIFYSGFADILGQPAEIRWYGENGNTGGITRLGHWKDSSNIGSLLGHEYQRLNIEEITDCVQNYEEYKMIMSCCRSTIDGIKPKAYFSTNPGGRGHGFVKSYFVDKANMEPYKDPESGSWRLFIPTTIEDNPILIQKDPEYYHFLRTLPEPLYSMWYKGSWDIPTGMFFYNFDTHLSIDAHRIPHKFASTRLFGALDIGVGHPTAFGLFYLTPEGYVELLFSYVQKQQDHRTHAIAILEKIEAFSEWVEGCFPIKIFCGHDFDRTFRASDEITISARQMYEDVFKNRGRESTKFVLANNIDKVYGCACLRLALSDSTGTPIFSYWKHYNEDFAKYLKNIPIDDTNPEIYEKITGDDSADMFRYAITGVFNEINIEKQAKAVVKSSRIIPLRVSSPYESFNFNTALV